MSNRTPAYVTCVVLTAMVLSVPQLLSGMSYLKHLRHSIAPVKNNLWLHWKCWRWLEEPFCNNHFWRFDGSSVFTKIDPETGRSEASNIATKYGELVAYGDQLWQIRSDHANPANGDTACQAISAGQARDTHRFLLDATPAELVSPSNDESGPWTVLSFASNAWKTTHQVVLPDTNRHWTIGNSSVSFQSARSIACISQKNRLHCFFRVNDRLLYRNGLNLRLMANQEVDLNDQPANAMEPANRDDEITHWTLVREKPIPKDQRGTFGMLIDGNPAALIVDTIAEGECVGEVFRFDGHFWSLAEAIRFPFGATQFRTVCRDDGERSYIVVMTAAGRSFVYSVSAAGVKQKFVEHASPMRGFQDFVKFLAYPCSALILAAIQAAITTGISYWFNRSERCYDPQEVLASIALRGVARGIDIGLVIVSMCLFGGMLTHNFDWASLAEALALQVRHPTISQAMNLAVAVFLWLGFTLLVFVYIQGKWGVTPGKWCCGLRVVQTTLKPCGFARSLAREVTLAFESCYLLCWAPAIVAMALTDRRQRLGDWAADTIVIRRTRPT